MMMDKSLTSLGLASRVVLVTGSASGIGLAIAQLFARAGARVVACDRDELGLAATVALLPGEGHWAERVDLGQTLEVETMVARILTIAGRLDVLINAEVQSDASMAVLSDEAAWSTLIDTHLKSRYFICRVAGEAMKRHHWGRIVNLADISGRRGSLAGDATHAVAQAGVMTMTRAFARELGPHGICVNTLSPGVMAMTMPCPDMHEDSFVAASVRIPLGRAGLPIEVARAAVFLGSDWASYITGHLMAVDGGVLMH